MPEVTSVPSVQRFSNVSMIQKTQVCTNAVDIADLLPYELVRSSLCHGSLAYAAVKSNISQSVSSTNLLIQDAPSLSEGINHWRFMNFPDTCGSVICGMSNVHLFESGERFNGLYLAPNGDLQGKGVLKPKFVKNMPQNPVIDWWMEVKGNEVDVYLSVNDVPQGHAFHLAFPNQETIYSIRPMISFENKLSSARMVVMIYIPIPFEPEQKYKRVERVKEITDCKWRLCTGKLPIKSGWDIELTLSPSVSVTIVGTYPSSYMFQSDGSIVADQQCASTDAMSARTLMNALEPSLKFLETMSEWHLDLDNQILSIESENSTQQFEVVKETPSLENPFVSV